MIVLGLDTSSSVVAVCIRHGADCWVRNGSARSANELVAALTDAVLLDAGVELAAVDRVGLAIGPGSFTGLRIGLAFCKGLSFGRQIPLCPVGSFDAAADVVLRGGSEACGVVALTGKERYAAAIYRVGHGCCWVGELTGGRSDAVRRLRAIAHSELQVVDLSGGAVSDAELGVVEVGAELSVAVADRAACADNKRFDIGELAAIQPLYGREASFRTLASRGLAIGE